MQTTRWEINRSEAIAENGMVAAKHPLAVEAGLKVLQEGGNAVDAAITTALAMGVVEPYMNGIGGGGFMLFHEAGSGDNHFLDYFMPAPLAATADMYEIEQAGATDMLGFRGVKDDANLIGHRSIGVPGMVAGATEALARFGTISLAQALEPAIRLAADGFEVSWHTMLMVGRAMKLITQFPATSDIFLKQGKFLHTADGPNLPDRLVQTDLANTLQRIADQGPDGFYRGEVAQAIVTELRTHGNPISEKDLAQYEARWVEPRTVSYRDKYQLVFGPSTGGSTVAETFNILENFDFAHMVADSAPALHRFIESARIAYADRWQHLSDETNGNVPWPHLESKAYARERYAGIDLEHAAEQVPAWQANARTSGIIEADGGCTTHLSVVDRDRNMVSITQTINMAWGSGVVVPGTGILLNDTMVLFDPQPGRTNSIQGGQRPLSSMTPMLVLKQGHPFLTLGAPGGRRIMGSVMKVLHNVLDFDMGIQEACANLALDCSGKTVIADMALGIVVCETLRTMGHPLDVREKSFLPRLFASPTGILVDTDSHTIHGGADPFHPGIASGW